jgi:hypothetical protein
MNADQEQNLLCTVTTIADHLGYAWNYAATLRGLQQYARECPDVLDRIGHFITTIYFAMWTALLLKLRHCSDTHKNVTGFPKLFKQLLAYLPSNSELRSQVQTQERRLHGLDIQRRVEKWRNEVIAHHTITGDFDIFRQMTPVSLDDIEPLIDELSKILHVFSVHLWNQYFPVNDIGQYTRGEVDYLVASLKQAAEQ